MTKLEALLYAVARSEGRSAVPPLQLRGRHLECPVVPDKVQCFRVRRCWVACRNCGRTAPLARLSSGPLILHPDFLLSGFRGGRFGADPPAVVPAYADDPSRGLLRQEMMTKLDQAVESWPNSRRALWPLFRAYLTTEQRPKPAEIARTCGLSTSTVKRAWRNLRNHFRTVMPPVGFAARGRAASRPD